MRWFRRSTRRRNPKDGFGVLAWCVLDRGCQCQGSGDLGQVRRPQGGVQLWCLVRCLPATLPVPSLHRWDACLACQKPLSGSCRFDLSRAQAGERGEYLEI